MIKITKKGSFEVDIRVGEVKRVEEFPEARKPMYKMWIDFGDEIGVKRSAGQLKPNYSKEELRNRQVLCAINLGTVNIAGFVSEVLTLGVPGENGQPILVVPEQQVPKGGCLY